MMYQSDWIMRQIQLLVEFVARFFFRTDTLRYEIVDPAHPSETDRLHRRLLELIEQGKLGEAEDFLFERFRENENEHLRLAVDFYQRLNALTDEELIAHSFSRAEIERGLRDILARSGVDTLGL